jgi:hypothetical protein
MTRELLTGRQLVGALAAERVGTWSADAVRQWIREDSPCPVAEHADQGKPHRYELAAVLAWLRVRAQAERAKGFTRGDGDDLVERIDAALLRLQTGFSSDFSFAADGKSEKINANTAAPSGTGAQAQDPLFSAPPVSQAKQQTEWAALSDVNALMEVLRGRDPRNWKAAEEALAIRRERLQDEGLLIPVADLDQALATQSEHLLAAIHSGRGAIKSALRDYLTFEMIAPAERIIDEQFDDMLRALGSTADLQPDAAPPPAAEA